MKRYALIFLFTLFVPALSHAASCGPVPNINTAINALKVPCKVVGCDDLIDTLKTICQSVNIIEQGAAQFDKYGKIKSSSLTDPKKVSQYLTDHRGFNERITGTVQKMGQAVNSKMVNVISKSAQLEALVKQSKVSDVSGQKKLEAQISTLTSQIKGNIAQAEAQARNANDRINVQYSDFCGLYHFYYNCK